MDWDTFLFATYEIIISVIFSLLTVFITMKILHRFLFKGQEGEQHEEHSYFNNIAIALFAGTIIICVLILVNSSILPSIDTLRTMVLSGDTVNFSMVLISFLYFLLFFILAIFFSTIIIFLTLKVYVVATRNVDEFEELKGKNIGIAIVMSMVILGITLSVKPSLQRFIFSLVQYESLETYIENNESENQGNENGGKLKAPIEKMPADDQ